MTPSQAIAQIDRQIARHGQTVTLRRLSPNLSTTIRAFVRGYQPDELQGGIEQGTRSVTISPTSLAGTAWAAFDDLPDALDSVLIDGRKHTFMQAPEIVKVGDTVVRINAVVRG